GFVGNDKAPERWIGVTAFITWDGDPFVGRENLRRLLPDDPVLLLDGPPPMMQQIQQAPAGSRLKVRGMLNSQSRIFLISGGKVTPVRPLGAPRVQHLIACAAALAALLGSAVATRAQDLTTGSVVLDMKGTLAADKAAASEAGWQAITFGFTGLEDNTVRWFGVVHASLFDGDTFDARTIITAASHYDPTVTIVGPPELAKKLHDLPNRTPGSPRGGPGTP